MEVLFDRTSFDIDIGSTTSLSDEVRIWWILDGAERGLTEIAYTVFFGCMDGTVGMNRLGKE